MSDSRTSGAQALERALAVLREIAGAAEQGRRLTELQKLTQLTKPTVHRLLKTLLHYGFVTQDAASHRYFVGPEIPILALSAHKGVPNLCDLAHAGLRALAEETGDTAFLMVRSAHDEVCVDRHIGPYPIKALTGEIGLRRPLGIGAGGIALLAALADAEIDAVLAANGDRMRHYPNVSEKLIRRAIKEARNRGHSYSDGHVIKAVRALGLPLRDRKGKIVAAISVGAIRERINRTNTPTLLAALERARRIIERQLRSATVK